jgi:DNA-binding NarL/FixJ family response regulator
MHILLADDEVRVRSALQMLLNEEPGMKVVAEVAEAEALLTQIRVTRPDLVLLDWGLPGLGAVGSLPALRLICPNLTVMVISGRPEAGREALAAGADAFVSKVDPPEHLLAALNIFARRINGMCSP